MQPSEAEARPGPDVIDLREGQIDAAGAVLARAFGGDPLMRYLFPDDAERARLLPWHFTGLVRYGYLYGAVSTTVTTTGATDGVAVWLPPQGFQDPLERLSRLEQAGLHQAPSVLGAAAFERLVGVVNHLERVRRRDAPAPHWYLNQVGVEPARRGQGIGVALLRPGLEQATVAGLPCYLETFLAANLSFYGRLKFHIVTAEVEPSSGLPFWTCLRQP